MSDFLSFPDLASRTLASSVICANDEFYAEKENLINPGAPVHDKAAFGHKGKVYDGWETRRRRDGGESDFAIVRLGVPGVLHGVDIDTSYFSGNYPPFGSVEAAFIEGYPSPDEVLDATWEPVLEKVALDGDSRNLFPIESDKRFTHVRLTIYPDGGVARFRVYGEPRPDAHLLVGGIDLAALENGGRVVDCSNAFYSSPANILMPGRPRVMSDGWENARRRDDGNDFVVVQLGIPGRVHRVEIDTSYFVGNAPGFASVTADDRTPLLPRARLQADTRHHFVVTDSPVVSQVRIDVFPDGGIARLRVWGEPA